MTDCGVGEWVLEEGFVSCCNGCDFVMPCECGAWQEMKREIVMERIEEQKQVKEQFQQQREEQVKEQVKDCHRVATESGWKEVCHLFAVTVLKMKLY